MIVDTYTKAVLTVIAVALSVLAIEQVSLPGAHAAPAVETHNFDNLQYQYSGTAITFFDKSTGDLWNYGAFGNEKEPHHEKLLKLGDALDVDK